MKFRRVFTVAAALALTAIGVTSKARAELVLSQLVVDLQSGKPARQDIEVINNPADEYKGIDNQLDKAIEVILEELKSRPEIPAPPPYPRKN